MFLPYNMQNSQIKGMLMFRSCLMKARILYNLYPTLTANAA